MNLPAAELGPEVVLQAPQEEVSAHGKQGERFCAQRLAPDGSNAFSLKRAMPHYAQVICQHEQVRNMRRFQTCPTPCSVMTQTCERTKCRA